MSEKVAAAADASASAATDAADDPKPSGKSGLVLAGVAFLMLVLLIATNMKC